MTTIHDYTRDIQYVILNHLSTYRLHVLCNLFNKTLTPIAIQIIAERYQKAKTPCFSLRVLPPSMVSHADRLTFKMCYTGCMSFFQSCGWMMTAEGLSPVDCQILFEREDLRKLFFYIEQDNTIIIGRNLYYVEHNEKKVIMIIPILNYKMNKLMKNRFVMYKKQLYGFVENKIYVLISTGWDLWVTTPEKSVWSLDNNEEIIQWNNFVIFLPCKKAFSLGEINEEELYDFRIFQQNMRYFNMQSMEFGITEFISCKNLENNKKHFKKIISFHVLANRFLVVFPLLLKKACFAVMLLKETCGNLFGKWAYYSFPKEVMLALVENNRQYYYQLEEKKVTIQVQGKGGWSVEICEPSE
jgi:hypothetical protein